MEVEISKAPSPETSASIMVDQFVEHVMSIMVLCGIEGISATKYKCGFGSSLNVTISPFQDAPKEVVSQGVIVKDALAKIMSVANVTRIIAKPTGDDMNNLREAWKSSSDDANSVNRGSFQPSGEGSSSSGTDSSDESEE